MQLLVTEGNPSALSVHFEDDEVVGFADFEDGGGVGNLVPAELGDVGEAIETAHVDECAEIGKSLDLAFDDVVDVDVVPEFVLSLLLFAFQNHTLGRKEISGLLCGLVGNGRFLSLFAFRVFLFLGGHKGEAEHFILVVFEVLDVTHTDLGRGHEHGVLSHSAAQTALDDFRHFEGELAGVQSLFRFLVLGASDVHFFLGKRDVFLVDADDVCFDGVARVEISGIVVAVDGCVCLINETVFFAAYRDIDAGLVRAYYLARDAFADLVVDKTRRLGGCDDVFHGQFFLGSGLGCRGLFFAKRCLFLRFFFRYDDVVSDVLSFTHKFCNLLYQPRRSGCSSHD